MSPILRVVLPYVVFAGLWIFLSDRVLAAILADPGARMEWSILKGLAFVLVTALLLSALLRRELATRARAEAARRESEERLSFALERSRMGGWELDLRDFTVRGTRQHDRIFGYDSPPERWSYEIFLTHVVPDDRPEVDRRFRAAVAAQGDWSVECRIARPDGSVRWIWETASPHAGADGRPARYVGIVQDVTDRHREQAEREALDDQLRQAQKMESVGRLAGGVAHDFNNLLGVILGCSELLLRHASESQRRPLGHVIEAAGRAAELTRQLLAFSRRQVVEPKVLDLNVVLARLQGMLGRLIGEDVALAIDRADGLGLVRADPSQLEQVVMNLSVNARAAMPGGGVLHVATANTELTATEGAAPPGVPPGRYVTLRVTDNGSGIEPEVLPKIFEPFYTTKEAGQGTGLGLATVYGIVKQAGGFISVTSEVGRGSTFTVYLPRAEGTLSPPEAGDAPIAAERPGTILVVEDESALRAITRQVLVEHGYRVLEAASAAEALDATRQHPQDGIDLLVTDVVLPGINGRQLADLLRASRPQLKVLYVSGYPDDVIAQRGILESGTQFLAKPYTAQALLGRVAQTLRS